MSGHKNIRYFLVMVLLAFSSVIKGEKIDAMTKHIQFSWAVMPQFNINLPGNWKILGPYDKNNMSFGGGIGGECRIQLKSDWLIDAGISICYDKLHISASKITPYTIYLERWTIPLSVSIGHSFGIDEEVDVIPLAGVEASYCFSSKVYPSNDPYRYNWNRLNISWGIGCGLCLSDKYEIDIVGYLGLPQMIRQSNTDLYDNKLRMSFKYFF